MGHFIFHLHCSWGLCHGGHYSPSHNPNTNVDKGHELFIQVLKRCRHGWVSRSHDVLLNSKPPWPSHHHLTLSFRHGDQSNNKERGWGGGTDEGREQWWSSAVVWEDGEERIMMPTLKHIPVDDSPVIDRVVEIHGVSRRGHLFSYRRIVWHKTIWKADVFFFKTYC